MKRAFILLFLGVAVALPAHAQQLVSTDPITISISPDFPAPYQNFSITPTSDLIDLGSSMVTISVNGAVVEKGSGEITGYASAGAPGSKTTIVVSVTNNGRSYQKTLVVRPADVALIVEPVSTTHPFYQGGSLLASQGSLRLVAIPDFRTAAGAIIPPASLVYTWRLGNQVLESSSGIGHSTVTATAPVRYRDATITLTVATQDSSIVAQASSAIAPIDPLMRIYQNDPLLGPLYDRALSGTLSMASTEQTFRMVPYYFAADPQLAWTVNSAASGADKDITVRSNGNGQGTALLTAAAALPSVFQSATAGLSVQFGQKKSLGIFGL
jgi:hypothetical protein